MELNKYQKEAKRLSKVEFGDDPIDFAILGLGISGESGEVSDLVKKFLRDHDAEPTEGWRMHMIEELGDTLWYVSQIALMRGISMETLAQYNLDKLASIRLAKEEVYDAQLPE